MLYGYKILIYCTSHVYETRFSNFIRGLNETLVENGWRVMVFCTESDLYKNNKNNDGSRKIFDLINYEIADAILISQRDLLNPLIKNKIITQSKNHNIPVVCLGNNPKTNCIEFDYETGFEAVVRHVIEEHNVTNLHFIAGIKGTSESDRRQDVFKKILEEHNIPFSDELVSYGDFWDFPTRKAVQKLVDEGRVPKAIICANDTMALSALSVLQMNGFKCPEDVIVTGFDGIQEIYYSTPKLTSVLCDFSELGRQTGKLLFELDRNRESENSEKVERAHKYVPTKPIFSESCGCSPVVASDIQNFISYTTNSYNRYRTEDIQLSNISALIHECKNPTELIRTLTNPLLYNMFVLLKAECLNPDLDPNVSHSNTTYGESMFVVLDSDMGESGSSKYIRTEELIPRMESILSNYKMPLIFTSLHSIDLPLGYLCFCFCNYERQNYIKIGQIASWLGNAFSGYRSMQYQRALQKQITNMYKHDSLTGLLNRNGFQQEYDRILSDPEVTEISLAMCDLDNLKHINDNFSHNEGDEAIRVVGQALSNASSGQKRHCYFCRYGGDEIIGLYPFKVDEKTISENLQAFLDNHNAKANKDYEVSTSLGIYSGPKVSFEEAFGKADKLMYKQKQTKKNRRK